MLRYNYNNASGLACRQFGASYGTSRYFYGTSGYKAYTSGEGFNDRTAGIPNGHLVPSCWTLPIKPGGMSSYENLSSTVAAVLTLGTPAFIQGSTSIAISSSTDLSGIAVLSGSITPFTELSPQNLADAVWNADANNYTTVNTTGKNLANIKTNSDLIPAAL